MWDEHLRKTAAHIAEMASNPGSVDHARWRLRQLLDMGPMYAALSELVRLELEKRKQS